MTPCCLAYCTVRDLKLVAAHGSIVDSPCPDIASHTSVAKWTPVNQAFLCNNAIVHNKLVPTYRSMVYSPCRHVTSHMPIARGTHIIIRFRTEASFPHSETVTACAAVIDLACAYSAAWSQTDRNEDTRIGNSCLSPWLLLLLSAASPSPSSCCLPVCHAHLQDPSVVISVPFSCLRCFAFGASSCSLFRFRSAMAAQTSVSDGTCLFFLPLRCLRHACCGFKTAVCEPSNP